MQLLNNCDLHLVIPLVSFPPKLFLEAITVSSIKKQAYKLVTVSGKTVTLLQQTQTTAVAWLCTDDCNSKEVFCHMQTN